jgi:hypothetical protein
MRAKPLKTRDLILSLSKDEAEISAACSEVNRRTGRCSLAIRHPGSRFAFPG